MTSRRASVGFGVAEAAVALLVGVGVFVALPARWAPVDVGAGLLVVLKVASSVSLLAEVRHARAIAAASAVVALVLGMLVVTALAVTAGWLGGIYGSVGAGGALLFALVAALVLPYLVVLPVVQLVWLLPNRADAR